MSLAVIDDGVYVSLNTRRILSGFVVTGFQTNEFHCQKISLWNMYGIRTEIG